MQWISEHDPIEEHDLNIDVDLLYMDYIRFIKQNEPRNRRRSQH